MASTRGMRLLLDGFVSKLLTEAELHLLLPHIARSIGMTPVGFPIINQHEWGPSAYQFLSESHIGMDYMYGTQVALEVFSCKLFNQSSTGALLIREFYITSVTKELVLFHEFEDGSLS